MSKFTTSCLVLSLVAVMLMSGCAQTLTPATGFVYSKVKGPFAATGAPKGSKMGTSECESFVGLVAVGDASIETAAKNAGITKISHVDYDTFSILMVYAKLTVKVYGE